MGVSTHKKQAPKKVSIAIITASTTRTLERDDSGHWMRKFAAKEGHAVVHHTVVPDHIDLITQRILAVMASHPPDVILLSGGTGVGPQDLTIEAIHPLLEKELTAFGPLFAQLSYEQIDAGIIGRTVVFCMPGSLKACKLACKDLIFPELGHLIKHVREG